MAVQFLMLGFSVLLPVFFGVYSPILTREILNDLRILRILHYVALAGLGMALYLRMADDSFFSLTFRILPVFLLFIVALVYAAVFAIITNNIEDLEADKISNPERPLVRNRVTKAAYYRAGIFCQVYALLLAILVQDAMFVSIEKIPFSGQRNHWFQFFSRSPLRVCARRRAPVSVSCHLDILYSGAPFAGCQFCRPERYRRRWPNRYYDLACFMG